MAAVDTAESMIEYYQKFNIRIIMTDAIIYVYPYI